MQWCGVDRFVLPAVKTVKIGSTSLQREPRGIHSTLNGFLKSSSVTAGGQDILAPASSGTPLKKPSVPQIDNPGRWGEVEGGC